MLFFFLPDRIFRLVFGIVDIRLFETPMPNVIWNVYASADERDSAGDQPHQRDLPFTASAASSLLVLVFPP